MDSNPTLVYKDGDKMVKSADLFNTGKSEKEIIARLSPAELDKKSRNIHNSNMKSKRSYR